MCSFIPSLRRKRSAIWRLLGKKKKKTKRRKKLKKKRRNKVALPTIGIAEQRLLQLTHTNWIDDTETIITQTTTSTSSSSSSTITITTTSCFCFCSATANHHLPHIFVSGFSQKPEIGIVFVFSWRRDSRSSKSHHFDKSFPFAFWADRHRKLLLLQQQSSSAPLSFYIKSRRQK